ncbi:hypothetical protein ACFQY4_14850 [Catellatospora bangladeshensis]|uniref:DUF3017 domain-containing protein n=1 Tax=Catellatospora bangladeshensis TaxID=310355 RepID=A0A8J3JM39_9ACTN|nr:hypothetical protein [Catellatospora bangladeshensis]GIF83108.1 hypothetical protein Cba03nite_44570 [Catellatospora bangladeshensis]
MWIYAGVILLGGAALGLVDTKLAVLWLIVTGVLFAGRIALAAGDSEVPRGMSREWWIGAAVVLVFGVVACLLAW